MNDCSMRAFVCKMNYKLKNNLPHKDENYLGSILKSRGIGDVETYLHPTKDLLLDPQLLNNIELGVETLYGCLIAGSQIFLQVDSDADGYTSAAILYNYIMRFDPNARITLRFHEGKQHGIIPSTVPDKISLVLLPDSGSNQFEEHKELAERGIVTLVIDHHLADKESEDAIIINNQLSPQYSNKSLCGAGVVYKFCQYFDTKYGLNFADEDLDLVAVGLVADMMDLRDFETHALVHYGLNHITNAGLLALVNKNAFSLNNRTQLTPTDVSFSIAPYINAITRVGTMDEKEIMFMAFTDGYRALNSTKRGARSGDIENAAEQMARLATNAKSRQQRLIDSAMEILEGRIQEYSLDENKLLVIFVKDEDKFDSNITGLIAMKLTAKYGKPTILVKLSDGNVYKGSARGLNDSDLPDLKQFFVDSGFFEYAEGHANAHGVGIKKDKIEDFIEYANTKLGDTQFGEKTYSVDYIFSSDETEIAACVLSVGSANIWGMGVETPLIVMEKIILRECDVTLMKNDSVKFTHHGVTFTIFKNPKACADLTKYPVMLVDVCGKANINEWAGKTIPQIFITDYNVKNFSKEF